MPKKTGKGKKKKGKVVSASQKAKTAETFNTAVADKLGGMGLGSMAGGIKLEVPTADQTLADSDSTLNASQYTYYSETNQSAIIQDGEAATDTPDTDVKDITGDIEKEERKAEEDPLTKQPHTPRENKTADLDKIELGDANSQSARVSSPSKGDLTHTESPETTQTAPAVDVIDSQPAAEAKPGVQKPESSGMTSGILTLTVVEAQLTRDTETFGQMDPFVTISTRDEKFKTAVKEDAGKNPIWNQVFYLRLKDVVGDMTMQVFDEDTTSDDKVGEAKIKLSVLCVENGIDDWFGITFDNKPSGKVHLKATWKPKVAAVKAPAAQAQQKEQPDMQPAPQTKEPVAAAKEAVTEKEQEEVPEPSTVQAEEPPKVEVADAEVPVDAADFADDLDAAFGDDYGTEKPAQQADAEVPADAADFADDLDAAFGGDDGAEKPVQQADAEVPADAANFADDLDAAFGDDYGAEQPAQQTQEQAKKETLQKPEVPSSESPKPEVVKTEEAPLERNREETAEDKTAEPAPKVDVTIAKPVETTPAPQVEALNKLGPQLGAAAETETTQNQFKIKPIKTQEPVKAQQKPPVTAAKPPVEAPSKTVMIDTGDKEAAKPAAQKQQGKPIESLQKDIAATEPAAVTERLETLPSEGKVPETDRSESGASSGGAGKVLLLLGIAAALASAAFYAKKNNIDLKGLFKK